MVECTVVEPVEPLPAPGKVIGEVQPKISQSASEATPAKGSGEAPPKKKKKNAMENSHASLPAHLRDATQMMHKANTRARKATKLFEWMCKEVAKAEAPKKKGKKRKQVFEETTAKDIVEQLQKPAETAKP